MGDLVQFSLFVGFAGLMVLLRLDAARFASAEWDDGEGDLRLFFTRLTWYAAGLALALMVFLLHSEPVSGLNLRLGPESAEDFILGLAYAGVGIMAAFVLAFLRNGAPRFPRPGRYPGGAVGSLGTAFFDEFLFRGVILGLLLGLGLPGWLAVVISTAIYAGTVRVSTAGRGWVFVVVAIAIGLTGGLVVVLMSGIGGAVVGHAATRFALFITGALPALRSHTGLEDVGLVGTDTGVFLEPRGWSAPTGDDDGGGRYGPLRPA